jgi:hypothetical protein
MRMSSGGKSLVPLGGSVEMIGVVPVFPFEIVSLSFSTAAGLTKIGGLPDIAGLPDMALTLAGRRTAKNSAAENKLSNTEHSVTKLNTVNPTNP